MQGPSSNSTLEFDLPLRQCLLVVLEESREQVVVFDGELQGKGEVLQGSAIPHDGGVCQPVIFKEKDVEVHQERDRHPERRNVRLGAPATKDVPM